MRPPSVMKAVPWLVDEVGNLLTLMDSTQPPICYVRSKQFSVAIYGYGDASGAG
jgi:hypothetical protein